MKTYYKSYDENGRITGLFTPPQVLKLPSNIIALGQWAAPAIGKEGGYETSSREDFMRTFYLTEEQMEALENGEVDSILIEGEDSGEDSRSQYKTRFSGDCSYQEEEYKTEDEEGVEKHYLEKTSRCSFRNFDFYKQSGEFKIISGSQVKIQIQRRWEIDDATGEKTLNLENTSYSLTDEEA